MGNISAAISWGDAAVQTVFWSSALFCLWFTVRCKWWKTGYTTAMFLAGLTLFMALMPAELHRLLGVNTFTAFYLWFVVIDLFAIAGVMLLKVFLIEREIRRRKKARAKRGPEREVLINT